MLMTLLASCSATISTRLSSLRSRADDSRCGDSMNGGQKCLQRMMSEEDYLSDEENEEKDGANAADDTFAQALVPAFVWAFADVVVVDAVGVFHCVSY